MTEYVAIVKRPENPSGHALVYLPHKSDKAYRFGPEILAESKRIEEKGLVTLIPCKKPIMQGAFELCQSRMEDSPLSVEEIKESLKQNAA